MIMCLTKSDLLGDPYKIHSRTGLDLGKQLSTETFSMLLQKLSLQLYAIEL